MSYVVEKQSDSQVQSLRSDPVRTRGPYPESIPDAVYSTLKLYPPSDGVSKYRVLLEQTKEDRSNTFLLYESAQFEDAQEQFAKIHKTLKPLVEDGVVMLSNYLLTMFDFEDTELTPSELLDVTGEDAPHEEYLLCVRDGQIQLQPTAATGSSGMLQMGGYPMPMPPKTTAIAALTPGMPKMPAQRPMHRKARAMPLQQPAQRPSRANLGRKQQVMAQQQPMQTEMVASNQSTPPPTAQYLLCVGNGQIQLQPTAATGSSVGDSVGAPMRKSLASKRAINVGAPPPLPPQTHPPVGFSLKSKLQDVLDRDEGEDEETTPREENIHLRSGRIVYKAAGTNRKQQKRAINVGPQPPQPPPPPQSVGSFFKPENPPPHVTAFKHNDCNYYRQLMEGGDSLSKAVDGSKDGPNYLHFAAERDEETAHKFIILAYDYILQLIQKQSSEKSDHDSYQIEQFSMAVDAKNKEGFTPLMLAVRAEHVESALALLLAGADPDVLDRDDKTALHHAAQLGNLELVRLLVVFFAKLEDVDTLLKTAGESGSKDASLCVEILEETKKAAASNLSGSLNPISLPDDTTFLLSLDGGSIKCVTTIQILLHLSKRMKEIQKQQGIGDPVRMQSYFDYMAGTSAGSFIALALRYCNNITLEMCRAAAFKVSQEVMSTGPIFRTETMERSLKEIFGEDVTMTSSDSEKQRVIITTVLGDKDPPVLHLMCNYPRHLPEPPKERRKPIPPVSRKEEKKIFLIQTSPDVDQFLSGERKVWEVARASSAAPYYFEPFKNQLIDGGVMANNPTLDSLMEIFRQGKYENKTVKIGLVLSIGTGIPITKQLKHVGVYRPCGLKDVWKSVKKSYSTLHGLINLFDQLVSQSTRSDGQEVERADAWCKAMDAQYVRLSPELSRNYDFQETDSITLTKMMYEGHVYALEQREKIDQVARLLLDHVRIN